MVNPLFLIEAFVVDIVQSQLLKSTDCVESMSEKA
jgi:hypothetical protein